MVYSILWRENMTNQYVPQPNVYLSALWHICYHVVIDVVWHLCINDGVVYVYVTHSASTATATTTTYSFCFSSLFFQRLLLCCSCHLTRSITVLKNDLCISFICRSEARLHTDRRFRQKSFPCRPAFDRSEIGIEWDSGHSQICNHDAAQSSGKALSWWPIFFEGV